MVKMFQWIFRFIYTCRTSMILRKLGFVKVKNRKVFIFNFPRNEYSLYVYYHPTKINITFFGTKRRSTIKSKDYDIMKYSYRDIITNIHNDILDPIILLNVDKKIYNSLTELEFNRIKVFKLLVQNCCINKDNHEL